MKNFYCMYQSYFEIGQQVADQFQTAKNAQHLVEQNEENEITQQVVEQIWKDITSIPWGHHTILIDKYLDYPEKALFYVHQTVENGWSRNMLLNFIGTGFQPIAISEYDLEKFYPEKLEGTMPTIEEIEARLSKK